MSVLITFRRPDEGREVWLKALETGSNSTFSIKCRFPGPELLALLRNGLNLRFWLSVKLLCSALIYQLSFPQQLGALEE